MKTTILFSVVLASTLVLQGCSQISKMIQNQISANTTTISGHATLDKKNDSSGIVVKIGKQIQTSSISIMSVTTNYIQVATTSQSGDFSFDVTMTSPTKTDSITSQSINMDTGLYTVVLSKDGYNSKTINNVPVILGQSVYDLGNVRLDIIVQTEPHHIEVNSPCWIYRDEKNHPMFNLPFKIQAIKNNIIDNTIINNSDIFEISIINMKKTDPLTGFPLEIFKQQLSWLELQNKIFNYDSIYSNYQICLKQITCSISDADPIYGSYTKEIILITPNE